MLLTADNKLALASFSETMVIDPQTYIIINLEAGNLRYFSKSDLT